MRERDTKRSRERYGYTEKGEREVRDRKRNQRKNREKNESWKEREKMFMRKWLKNNSFQ